MPSQGTRSAAKRGPRPKHVPQRTCVVCRDTSSKRTLTRIVRVADGEALVDPTGRKNGRGAYICDSPSCWDRAITTSVLNKALRTELSSESIERLKESAAGLHQQIDDPDTVADSKEHAQ